MSAGYFGPNRTKLSLSSLHSSLITGTHILHSHAILDAYSHLSVRNPDSTDTFFLASSTSPSCLTSASQIHEFKFADGSPLDSASAATASAPSPATSTDERFIDAELYKRFPGVNCVVHSHAPAVLPFCTAKVPLKPVIPGAGFLGAEAPAWDIASAYSHGILASAAGGDGGDKHDRLVRSPNLGAAFAIKFSKTSTSSGFVYAKLSESVSSLGIGGGGGKGKDGDGGSLPEPDWPVLLMRGHGFTVAARGIEEAVYMAINTVVNAQVQREALQMSGSYFGGTVEGSVPEKGGAIKGGKVKVSEEVQYLTAKEAKDAWETARESGWLERGWMEWKRMVERNPLYENAVEVEA
jgi:ribulose-5-phosphate 4-epimerase/fuculose-1-phosphate aldolase